MTETADNRSIAVVRARLQYTDRRSLSQAWFSALHLAQASPARGMPARRASDSPSFLAHGPAPSAAAGAGARQQRARPAQRLDRANFATSADSGVGRAREGRVAASARATATFERARSYPPFSTSLTVGVDGARIKLLLRREGPTLHVIALCAPGNVDLVRRALACADAHLRLNGESVRACVRPIAGAGVPE